MAATDQILAIGAVFGVIRELVRQDCLINDKHPGMDSEGYTAYLFVQQVVIAFALSDSFRGFLYVLCMPIGLYKIGRLLTRWAATFWFSQCWEWWEKHSQKWRDRVRRTAIIISLICAATLVYGVDNGCPEDGCDPIEDWV
jgi:hypothetical protein